MDDPCHITIGESPASRGLGRLGISSENHKESRTSIESLSNSLIGGSGFPFGSGHEHRAS
jgi:hypothetical protein